MTIALTTTDSLGDVVVDGNGRTLYLFEQDNGTESACTGGCAEAWPPAMSDTTPAAGDGVDAALLGVSNGQVTYNGHLLYYFSGDLVAGDMNGVGIPDWYPVTAAGEAAGDAD
jgi:predicted lipoprotein with Yx(FWY)xxD motif